MTPGNFFKRIILQFHAKETEIPLDLSGVVVEGGFLWIASDETTSIERLTKIDDQTYGDHRSFPLKDLLLDFNPEDGEVDIEGLSYDGGYLWVVGSHSSKRKKVKKGNVAPLQIVKTEKNRYLLARIPMVKGELIKSAPEITQTAAHLELSNNTNILIEALKLDPYFKDILGINLPGKDNGFDIEGLLVNQGQIFLGLRGPVLRGITIILEVAVTEKTPEILTLKPIGSENLLYKKHFLDLDGLGVRDLCLWGEDILILTGPTMDLDGSLRLFRWHKAFQLPDQSFTPQNSDQLEFLFEIPHGRKCDKAEGITILPDSDQELLVIYDSPNPERITQPHEVQVDVFRLN